MRFLPLVFSWIDLRALNSYPKIFLNQYRIRGDICIQKLFSGVWYPAILCSSGSDTPQGIVRQGIRPHRTLFCGVSDPAEQASDIKCTQVCHCSEGFWYTPGLNSARSDTLQDFFLGGVLDPIGRWSPHGIRRNFWKLAIPFKGRLIQNFLPVQMTLPKANTTQA